MQDGLEFVEYTGVSGELLSVYQFGSEGSSISQVIDVTKPPEPALIARAILGWSSWNRGLHAIDRHIPLKHGAAPWLYATAISSMHAVGKMTWNAGTLTTAGYTSGERWRCNVTYRTLPYQVEADAISVGRLNLPGTVLEYHRYCEHVWTPGIEIIDRMVSTGQWKFAQGPSTGTAFPRSIQTRAPKGHYLIRWHQVPHGAIFSANHRLSTNIEGGLGKVNADLWPNTVSVSDPVAPAAVGVNGWNPGELLLTQVGLNPTEQPVSPQDTGCSARSNIPRAWIVDFHFIAFTPPTDPNPAYAPRNYGHYLVPSITKDLNTNYYYLVTSNGNADTGRRLYESYNFDKLFEPL